MARILSYKILILAAMLLIGLLVFVVPAAADTNYAWLDVSSNPSGAWACIDSYDCHDTPITWTVDSSSYHRITVYMDGYEMYTEYVGAGSDQTTTYVRANLNPVPASIGWLNVNNDGAQIWIDGVYYGNGAWGVPLSPGSHTLDLQKSGYNDYSGTFSITGGQTTTLSPAMTPYSTASYGELQISSTPAGAAVFVNNNYEGTTSSSSPLYVTQLSPGSYTVRLTLPDYQTYTETSVVRAGINNDIWATMVPNTPGPTPDTTGQITVGSTPSGANIYLDNAYKGIAPMTLADVPAGSHTIILRQNGYADWTSTVNVAGGDYTQVSGTLNPTQPIPTTPAPQPTKSPVSAITIISAIGICGAIFLVRKRE